MAQEQELVVEEPKLDAFDATLMRACVAARLFPSRSEPTKVAHYAIEQRIGQGAMGLVYRAHDTALDRHVALKLLRHSDSSGRRGARLLREAQALAQVSHPNVVQIFEVGRHGEQVYLAMELIDGVSLRERSYASTDALLTDFIAAGRGLAAAHRAGLVHRDFKPDNVLVGDDGRVRVLDFGLARPDLRDAETSVRNLQCEVDHFEHSSLDISPTLRSTDDGTPRGLNALQTPMTRTGACLGTPAYMAPEQFAGTCVDARSDQFSFAVALWEKLLGDRPFRGQTAGQVQLAIQDGPLASELNRLPRRLRIPLAKALSAQPANRYTDMNALLDALEPAHAARGLRFGWAAVAAAAIAGAAVLGLTWGEADPCSEAPATIQDSWNQSRRDEMRRKFHGLDSNYAADVWRSSEAALDKFSRDWSRVRAEGCREGLRNDGMPPEAHGAQLLCLGGQLSQFQAATELLAQAENNTITRAVTMAARLPDPKLCQQPQHLSTLITDTTPRTNHARQLDTLLGRAWGQKELGRHAEALKTASTALAEAQAHGDTGREARAEVLRGEIQMRLRQDFEAAAATLRRAIELAKLSGSQRVELEAKIWLFRILGGRLQRFDEQGSLKADIIQQLAHLGNAPELRAHFEVQLGVTAWAKRQFESAIEHDRRALKLRRATLGAKHIEVGVALNNLGNNLVMAGRVDEASAALAESREILEHELGPRHPWIPIIQTNFANTLVARGDQTHDETLRAQLLAKAEASYRAVVDARRQAGITTGVSTGNAIRALANVQHKRGETTEALELYRAAEATYKRSSGVAPHVFGITATGIGHCLGDLGRHTEAVPVLEAALTIFDNEGDGGLILDRAEASLALAKALHTGLGRDPKPTQACRVLQLARQAETLYAKEPGNAAHREHAATRRWLRGLGAICKR